MKDLLANYSISEVLLIIVIVILAIKEAISIIDWFKARIKAFFDKGYKAQEEYENLENEIEDLNKFYGEKKKIDQNFEVINQAIADINSRINMLIDSDKENIKAYITERHHYFVEEKGWIDYHSMDCLEKRFAIYEKEHGNSFAEDLMEEMRALPKQPFLKSDISNLK